MRTIALASDHAGFRLKESIKDMLQSLGHAIRDFGTNSERMIDYPNVIRPAARAVASGACDLGIVMGGSGNGEAIVANKVRGIRCAVCWDEQSAHWAKEHNNANVIAIGGRVVDEAAARKIVHIWLNTDFEGGRHNARIAAIEPDVY
jgi:ribose 5-phosphate isomerase B